MDITGRTVIITGASEGIGRQLAVDLAARGARTVLAARSPDGLAETVRRCERAGGQTEAVPTDVANPADCAALIARAVDRFGGVDVLINNAGISMTARFDETRDLTAFDRIMRVNYLGAVYCTHHALPHLKARRGLLVAVSSLQGKSGFPMYSAYAASKHAMQGFFDALRIELRASGVDVLVVSPGVVATDIHAHRLGPDGSPGDGSGRQYRRGAMSVEECSRQIFRAIERRQRELVMTAPGKLGMWLKLIAPGLLDRMIERAVGEFERRSRSSGEGGQ